MSSSDSPVVAVWRSLWLPPSETFIRDHIASLTRWRAVKLGLYNEPSELGVAADFAPFRRTGTQRYLHSLASRAGYKGVYGGVIRAAGPLLLHAHFGPDAISALPISRIHRLPLIVTFHGFDLTSRVRNDHDGRYRRALRRVFDRAELLLPASEFLAGRLTELGAPEEKIRVHYLGIPLRASHDESNSKRSGVLFVGRLTPGKGVRELIDAYCGLPDAVRSAHPLRIVGDGPLGPELRRLGSARDPHIEFAGWQNPAEVALSMRRAQVFCAPSRTSAEAGPEGFGLVYLEAASAGLPVVAFTSGGVPEAVQDRVTGLLATEGDVGGLRARLDSILTDPALARRLGRAGQRRVESQFDIRRRTPLLEDHYDRLTQQWPTRTGAQ